MTQAHAVVLPEASRRTVSCPCCRSEDVALSFQKGAVDYYVCRVCGLTFVFPWPDDRTLRDHYEDYGRRYYSLEGLRDSLLSPKHYRRELQLLQRTTKASALLDVGCSVGGFVKAAGELGYAAQGIDISATSAAIGQAAGLNIRAGDFLSSDFRARFDVITMWATLEHLPEPNRYVMRAREMLRPGGVVLASVPNYSGITQRLIGARDRYVGIDHLNYWTARGFAEYFRSLNFDSLEIMTFAFNPMTLVSDWTGRAQPRDCEQMAVEQKRSASWKDTWIGWAHRAAERLLNLALLGDCVAVASRLRN